jgi:hypothetical protein
MSRDVAATRLEVIFCFYGNVLPMSWITKAKYLKMPQVNVNDVYDFVALAQLIVEKAVL